jgi:hypothetical protein
LEAREQTGKRAQTDTGQAAEQQAKGIADLTAKMRALRTELVAMQQGGSTVELKAQLRDLTLAAAEFNLTPETLKNAPVEVRELVQAYVELEAQLRRTEVHYRAAEASRLRQAAGARRHTLAEIGAQQEAETAQAKATAAGQPGDIVSQQALGIQSARTRVAETRARLEKEGLPTEEAQQYAESIEAANTKLAVMTELIPQISASAADLLVQYQQTGEVDFAGIIAGLERMLIQLGLNIAAASLLNALLGGAPAAGGGATTGAGGAGFTLGTMFGGPRQAGGHMSAGRLYRVNERGAEFFKPDVGGRAIPMEPGDERARGPRGGGGTVVNNFYHKTDPGTVATLYNMIKRDMPDVVVKANTRKPPPQRPPY